MYSAKGMVFEARRFPLKLCSFKGLMQGMFRTLVLNLESYLLGNLMRVSNYADGRHHWLAKVMY